MALQPMVPARLVRRSAAARRLRDAVVVDRPRLRRGLVHRHRLRPRQEAPPLQCPLDALDRYRRSGHIDACAHLVRVLVPHRPYRIRACRGGRHHERHPMGHVGRAVLAHEDVVLRFLYRHHRRPGHAGMLADLLRPSHGHLLGAHLAHAACCKPAVRARRHHRQGHALPPRCCRKAPRTAPSSP